MYIGIVLLTNLYQTIVVVTDWTNAVITSKVRALGDMSCNYDDVLWVDPVRHRHYIPTITNQEITMRQQHTDKYYNFINNNKLVQIAKTDVNHNISLAFEQAFKRLNNINYEI